MPRMRLQSMCPEKLAPHLDMHVARLDSYLKMRTTEIVSHLEASQSRNKSGASPTDVVLNTMYQKGAKGAEGKGKTGKSKGKGSTYFEGECHNCGKYGHRSSDCWSEATTAKGDQKGEGKGLGKGKGKGKGKGEGEVPSIENQCWPGEQGAATQESWNECNKWGGGTQQALHAVQNQASPAGDQSSSSGNIGPLFGLEETPNQKASGGFGIRQAQFSAMGMIQKSLREPRESGASQEESQPLQNTERNRKLEMKSSWEMKSWTRRGIEAGRPVFSRTAEGDEEEPSC